MIAQAVVPAAMPLDSSLKGDRPNANETEGAHRAVGSRWLVSGTDEGQSPSVPSPDEAWYGPVSGKPNVDVPVGTLNSALRQAGLKK